MNVEIERKFSVSDLSVVKERCMALGATEKGSKRSVDIYFQILGAAPRTKYLRLRGDGKAVGGTLSYHEVPNALVTDEWDVDVSDLALAQEILEKLGFPYDVSVDKQRTTLDLGKCEIVLDQVEGLGSYVEIEAPNEDELNALAEKLGLAKTDEVSGQGYPDLLKNM